MKPRLLKIEWSIIFAALALCAVLIGGCNSNSNPVISSIKAEKEWVEPSGKVIVDCIAGDSDGDILTYTWSAIGGSLSGQGSIVYWTAPLTVGPYLITANVTDGRGGKAAAQLTINVVKANNPPIIKSLIAEPSEVKEADTCAIECIASDPDGDKISYQWETTGGVICGQGPDVSWTAPLTPGPYILTARVMDDRGGDTKSQLSINVLVNHPPVIESITAKPSVVGPGGISEITCVASDPDGDGLKYNWTADRGSISGEGAVVNWTGPTSCDTYVVILIVSDSKGKEASGEVDIRVKAG
jgi:hypothetical protein